MNENMCRVCLAPGLSRNTTVSIFDTDQNAILYSTKLLACVNISLVKDDGLPSRICQSCIDELNVAFHFVQRCLTSDNTLRKYKQEDIPTIEKHDETIIKNELENNIKREISIKLENLESEVSPNETCEDKLFEDYCSDNKTLKAVKVRKKYIRKKPRPPKSGPLQCTECGKLLSNASVMIQHMRTHTGERPYRCNICGAQFKLKGALVRHQRSHDVSTRQLFICEFCGKHFTSKYCIINHFKIHSSEQPYSCKVCHKRFNQHSSLSRHKKVHLPEKSCLCSICGKAFRDKGQVQKHTRTVHSDVKNFNCHLCNKSFKSSTSLKAHIQYLHSNEMNNVCNFCGMAFKTKGNMKLHIDRRHSQKSGTCDICFKAFSDLESHMYKHSGEKPFVCTKCDQAFSSKRSLAYHYSIKHENADKFKCSVEDCNKSFPILPRLEYHLAKEHNHKTSHKCSHCAKSFIRSCDLTKHLKCAHTDKLNIK